VVAAASALAVAIAPRRVDNFVGKHWFLLGVAVLTPVSGCTNPIEVKKNPLNSMSYTINRCIPTVVAPLSLC
jgi:hypothetical protein